MRFLLKIIGGLNKQEEEDNNDDDDTGEERESLGWGKGGVVIAISVCGR